MPAAAFASSFLPSRAPRASRPWVARTRPVTPRAAQAPPFSTASAGAENEELAENQRLYKYKSPPTIPGISFIEAAPADLPGQNPSIYWFLTVARVSANVLLNFSKWTPSALFGVVSVYASLLFSNLQKREGVKNVLDTFNDKTDASTIVNNIAKRWPAGSRISGTQFEEKSPILAPYREMWNTMDLPPIADYFLEDKVFARLRVAGYNPLTLTRVFTRDNLPFDVADSNLPNQPDSIDAAIAENRLYFQDFSAIAPIEQQRNSAKIFVVCKSLFVIPPAGDGQLQPVAIEVDGDLVLPPSASGLLDTRWAIAKLALNNCDAMHHELIAHLGRTHLLLEPFVAATMRQLPSDHPVHVILKPHFEGTVFINDSAANSLVAPGGDVDNIFAGEIASVMAWCAELVINNHYNNSMPDVELATRGVMDPILDMPYREDALEHFEAMNEWIYSYLSHYYKSDDQVVNDRNLQNWVAELVSDEGGKIKGFGDNNSGKVSTVKYLARAITFAIFSASVQHAAVNFPQLSLMSYGPSVPGGLWGVPPKPDEPSDVNKWSSILTPLDTAVEALKILGVIGGVYYTKLGQYKRGDLPRDREIKAALKTYQGRLEKIDTRIANRERNARLKYEYMRPGNVPQSINI